MVIWNLIAQRREGSARAEQMPSNAQQCPVMCAQHLCIHHVIEITHVFLGTLSLPLRTVRGIHPLKYRLTTDCILYRFLFNSTFKKRNKNQWRSEAGTSPVPFFNVCLMTVWLLGCQNFLTKCSAGLPNYIASVQQGFRSVS